MKYMLFIGVLLVLACTAYVGTYLWWRSHHVMSAEEYMPDAPAQDGTTRPDVMYISVNEVDDISTRIFAPMVWLDGRITHVEPVSE